MKPRSVRFRENARALGGFAFLFIIAAIFCGSCGYSCQLAEWLVLSLALYCAAFLMVIASVALFLDMHDAYQAADREEYWENRSLRI